MKKQRHFYSLLKFLLAVFSFFATFGTAEIILRLFNHPVLSSSWILDSKDRVLDADLITVPSNYLDDAFYDSFLVQGSTKLVVALGDSFTVGCIPSAKVGQIRTES